MFRCFSGFLCGPTVARDLHLPEVWPYPSAAGKGSRPTASWQTSPLTGPARTPAQPSPHIPCWPRPGSCGGSGPGLRTHIHRQAGRACGGGGAGEPPARSHLPASRRTQAAGQLKQVPWGPRAECSPLTSEVQTITPPAARSRPRPQGSQRSRRAGLPRGQAAAGPLGRVAFSSGSPPPLPCPCS